MNIKTLLLPLLCLLALMTRCSVESLAGGSDNPDFIITGTVLDTTGLPAKNAVVTIVPAAYNPIADSSPVAETIDTTDERGAYRLGVTHKGVYSVQSVHLLHRTRLLMTGISITNDTTALAPAGLKASASVKVCLPAAGINTVTGYIYVPGTTFFAFINNRADTLVLDSVPPGILPLISYAATNAAGSMAIRYDVPVVPGCTTVISNPSWNYSRRIVLNTTATGADIPGAVMDFPVLIRLDGNNFEFSRALPGGADIRFSKDNGFLAHEIEHWDQTGQRAEIWVRVDTIFGNNGTQALTMYWGNATADDASNGAGVFDTANGFIGAWHMNENPVAGSASIRDRTANAHHASPFGTMTAANSVQGAIGNALELDGKDDYLNVGNVSVAGHYSVGLWVLLDTLEAYQRLIFRNASYTLWYDKDEVSLRMEHMSAEARWYGLMQNGGTRVPMITGAWYFVTATFDGSTIRLYNNGVEVSRSDPISVIPRASADPLFFGKSDGTTFVNGILDEIRIEGVARPADWIRLCYLNQGKEDKLVVFK